MSILQSKFTRAIPSRESRAFHMERNRIYTPDKFQNYNDWFYFIHVDPFTRWIHAIGMVIGVILYYFSAYELWLTGFSFSVVVKFLVGVFFFYFLPLISHYIYDGGSAKSTPDRFHSTLIPVIHINLLTLTGRYDKWLRKFMVKYPFTREAWQLEETEGNELVRK
ncbi:hypothetical protein ACJVC5_04065 [Peredibacter sp. HCB2-198]|uniref:hypothetical protein n=1 Tax=Peredibacter sp. HCB2-198 TaxID=3383025 RepID=UPI0038B46E9B